MTGLLALCLLLQQEWIDQLRSDRIDDREEAERELRKLGAAAVPDLEKAAKDKDPEVAGRAQRVLKLIQIDAIITPALARAMPDVADRLAKDEWTRVLLDASRLKLRTADLDPLALRAMEQSTGEEVDAVLSVVLEFRLRSALPAVVPMIGRSGVDAVLHALGTRDLIPLLAPFLDSEIAGVREDALRLLSWFRAIEEAPKMRRLLEDKEPRVRGVAVSALAWLDRDEIPGLLRLIADPDPEVRRVVIRVVRERRAYETAEKLLPLLKDRNPDVREDVVEALLDLRGRIPLRDALALLEERFSKAAPEALRRLPLGEVEPEIRKLLDDPEKRLQGIVLLGSLRARDSADEIEKFAGDSDAQIREAVLWALFDLRGPRAEPRLAAALEDADPRVRNSAVRALAGLRRRTGLPGMLDDPDEGVRKAALDSIVRLKARDLIPEIVKRLPRISVANALVEMRAFEAAPHLVEFLDDPDTRREALAALRILGGRAQWKAVAGLLRDEDPTIRAFAAQGLGYMDAKPHADEVASLLQDESDAVRAAAARTCRWFRHPALRDRIGDPSPAVREEAAILWGEELLGDSNGEVQIAALRSVGERRILKAIPRVEALLSNSSLRTHAISTLCILRAKESGPKLYSVLPAETDYVLQALAVLGDVETLARALGHENPGVRGRAASWMWDLEGPRSVPRLLPLLQDPDPSVRRAALLALRRVRLPEAEPLLQDECGEVREAALGVVPDRAKIIPLLRDPIRSVRLAAAKEVDRVPPEYLTDRDPGVREAAVRAAGRLRLPVDLRPLLQDREVEVRLEAIRAVESLGAREPALAALLRDPEPEVRYTAVRAMAALGMREQADAIAALLDDYHGQHIALRALHRLRVWSPLILGLLEDHLPEVRVEAAEVVSDFLGKKSEPHLTLLLRDSESGVRRTALALLHRLGIHPDVRNDPEEGVRALGLRFADIPELIEALREGSTCAAELLREWDEAEGDVVKLLADPWIRLRALSALRRPHDALRPMLNDEDPRVRARSVTLLGQPRMDDEDADVRFASLPFAGEGDLVRALSDSESQVRTRAADLAGDRGVTAAIPKLVAMLDDRNARKIAVVALGRLRAREGVERLLGLLEDIYVGEAALTSLLQISKDLSPRIAKIVGPRAGLLEHLGPEDVEVWLEDPRRRECALVVLSKHRAPDEQHLEDPDPKVRAAGVRGLARWKTGAAAIARLLTDRDPWVQAAARDALVELGAAEQVRPLLRDPELRRTAFDLLRRMKAPLEAREFLDDPILRSEAVGLASKEELLSLLLDPDLRDAAARRLGTVRAKEAIPALRDLLPSAAAIDALDEMGEPIDPKYLGDPDPAVRLRAAWALRGLRTPEPWRKLVKDPAARSVALRMLALIGAYDPEMARLLEDRELGYASLRAMVRLGVREPAILRLLDEEDLRVSAATAIGELRWKEAAPELIRRLADSSERMRGAAAQALGRIGAKEAAEPIAILLDDPDPQVRAAAAQALGELRFRDGVPRLLHLLRDRDAVAREAAAEALGLLDAKDVAAELSKLLRSDLSWRRGTAAWALARVGVMDSKIEELLLDPDVNNRVYAARALGRLKTGMCALIRALSDRAEVRYAALRALGSMGAREAAPEIRRMREGEAAEELCRLGFREDAPRLLRAEGYRWTTLNALRKPDAWKGIESRETPAREGDADHLLATMAKEAGLKIEGLDLVAESVLRRGPEERTVDRGSLADAFEQVLPWGFEVILEDDRIRIVTRAEAAAFWEEWLKK